MKNVRTYFAATAGSTPCRCLPIDAVSSPIVVSRPIRSRSARASLNASSASLCSVKSGATAARTGALPAPGARKASTFAQITPPSLRRLTLLDTPCVGFVRSVGGDDRFGGQSIVLVSYVDRREPTEFSLGVPRHFLKGRVHGDIASVRTEQGNANRGRFRTVCASVPRSSPVRHRGAVFQRNRRVRR